MAMILLSLSVLSFPVTAEDWITEEVIPPETTEVTETTDPLEAEDSTGLDFVEVFPVVSEGELYAEEIPSGGLIGGNPPSAEPYAAISSTVVPDGVYALRNIGNGNLWMDIAQNTITPGAYVQQYAFSNSPVDDFSRSGLFKVSYNNSTGTYVIRSMLNNLLSFGFVGDYVKTKVIPADDADVALADTFYHNTNEHGLCHYAVWKPVHRQRKQHDSVGCVGCP